MTYRNETSAEKKTRMNEKFDVKLSAKEIFVLQCALERFVDIDDSEFAKAAAIGDKIKLPTVDIDWEDVASKSCY